MCACLALPSEVCKPTHVCKWTLTCAHTSRFCHVLRACVAFTISGWPLISLICSTHLSNSSLSLSLHSRWLQHRGCDTTSRLHAALLCDISLPPYAWSSGTFIKQRERNAQTKTTSLNSEILYSFERSGSTLHIYLEQANWFNLPCLHLA